MKELLARIKARGVNFREFARELDEDGDSVSMTFPEHPPSGYLHIIMTIDVPGACEVEFMSTTFAYPRHLPAFWIKNSLSHPNLQYVRSHHITSATVSSCSHSARYPRIVAPFPAFWLCLLSYYLQSPIALPHPSGPSHPRHRFTFCETAPCG
jgi:hypothetical protein